MVAENPAESSLPYDLAPGDSVRVVVSASVPSRAGDYRLTIGLAQGGDWFPNVLTIEPLAVRAVGNLLRAGNQRGS